MNIDIGKKREHKRLKRLKAMAGRLTAFGSKTYPEAVRRQMLKAERLRKRGIIVEEPVAATPWTPPQVAEKPQGFFKKLFGKKENHHEKSNRNTWFNRGSYRRLQKQADK